MMKKEVVWAFYAIVIAVLAVIGYYIGKKHGRSEVYASGGALIGSVISISLWLSWGKKNTE